MADSSYGHDEAGEANLTRQIIEIESHSDTEVAYHTRSVPRGGGGEGKKEEDKA
jgi:hypothetical protein